MRAAEAPFAPGDRATFTYSLAPDPTSEIGARLAPRTGQPVTILHRGEDDAGDLTETTPEQRGEEGTPAVYCIRFADGHEDTAFEDELTSIREGGAA